MFLKKDRKTKVSISFYWFYCVKSNSKAINKYKQEISFICYMFVLFCGLVFQQTISIPMGTNCAPLLADLFLHAYEADFLSELLKNEDRKLSQTINSSFHYIDDVLSLNNSRFGDYLHRIYLNELEVKNNTDTVCSYIDLHLEFDNGGGLKTKLHDKRDVFTFSIVKFPLISSIV